MYEYLFVYTTVKNNGIRKGMKYNRSLWLSMRLASTWPKAADVAVTSLHATVDVPGQRGAI